MTRLSKKTQVKYFLEMFPNYSYEDSMIFVDLSNNICCNDWNYKRKYEDCIELFNKLPVEANLFLDYLSLCTKEDTRNIEVTIKNAKEIKKIYLNRSLYDCFQYSVSLNKHFKEDLKNFIEDEIYYLNKYLLVDIKNPYDTISNNNKNIVFNIDSNSLQCIINIKDKKD